MKFKEQFPEKTVQETEEASSGGSDSDSSGVDPAEAERQRKVNELYYQTFYGGKTQEKEEEPAASKSTSSTTVAPENPIALKKVASSSGSDSDSSGVDEAAAAAQRKINELYLNTYGAKTQEKKEEPEKPQTKVAASEVTQAVESIQHSLHDLIATRKQMEDNLSMLRAKLGGAEQKATELYLQAQGTESGKASEGSSREALQGLYQIKKELEDGLQMLRTMRVKITGEQQKTTDPFHHAISGEKIQQKAEAPVRPLGEADHNPLRTILEIQKKQEEDLRAKIAKDRQDWEEERKQYFPKSRGVEVSASDFDSSSESSSDSEPDHPNAQNK